MDAAILNQLCNYCAYRERCIKEVREKLQKLQVPIEERFYYIDKLVYGNYLNEERFAKAYANGHARKGWGKKKIKMGLTQKQVSKSAIEQALLQIDAEDYSEKLLSITQKKWPTVKGKTLYERKQKLMKFLLSKGYEMVQIKEQLRTLA